MPDRTPSCFTHVRHDADAVTATVHPAFAEAACAGHFPDEPLLPGSVLLDLMTAAARLTLAEPARLAAAEHAVFRRRVRPSDAIAVVARPEDGLHVTTTIHVGSELAATGQLRFEPSR